ncbi:transcriptional regulator [Rummeliibacillus pycnus]|uniref:transcriptional regulator n=1 Tax=Rummeliibacillus pycnus TaxID=101070 RepID=UPI000C9CE350|nr:transcriptional regulator [Rummeliibacillus pycnus]
MDMYREGYERYCNACEEFGLESKDFYFFINHLTEEQLNAFKEYSKGSEELHD